MAKAKKKSHHKKRRKKAAHKVGTIGAVVKHLKGLPAAQKKRALSAMKSYASKSCRMKSK